MLIRDGNSRGVPARPVDARLPVAPKPVWDRSARHGLRGTGMDRWWRAPLSPNPRTTNLTTLLSGSGVVGTSRHQGGDELAEEGPAPAPGVVHELEEGEVERQLLLREAAVGPEPGAQQGPDALHRVDVHLAEAVAVLVARVLAPGVTHGLVAVAPLFQPGVDV